MANSRIDDITDGAWLVLSSVALVVIFERLLVTLEQLVYSGSSLDIHNNRSRVLRLAHGFVMVIVSIAAATISLPDDWVRSIVSSLGVGVGFALRDALSEALYGVQCASSKLRRFKAFPTLEDATKPDDESSVPTLEIVQEFTMSCKIQTTNGRQFTVPWSYLHKRVVENVA